MICGSRDIFDFCSHAVIITVYYKILDNLHDKGFFSKLVAALIYPAVALMHRKAKRLAPEAEKAVADAMKLQAETEAKPSPSIDESAHPRQMHSAEFSPSAHPRVKKKLFGQSAI